MTTRPKTKSSIIMTTRPKMKSSIKLLAAVLLLSTLLPSCVSPSMGGYAMGQRSYRINTERNQRGALTSDAQLHSNRNQRANEYEEARHADSMRYYDDRERFAPLTTTRRGLGELGGVRSGLRGIGIGF